MSRHPAFATPAFNALVQELSAAGFSIYEADKPEKFGWEIVAKNEVAWGNCLSLPWSGQVLDSWDHTLVVGDIFEPGAVEKISAYWLALPSHDSRVRALRAEVKGR